MTTIRRYLADSQSQLVEAYMQEATSTRKTLMDRIWTSRIAGPLAVTTAALASHGSAQGVTFDTANLESTATGVLGVGALIAVGFAVFKVGKRAMNRV